MADFTNKTSRKDIFSVNLLDDERRYNNYKKNVMLDLQHTVEMKKVKERDFKVFKCNIQDKDYDIQQPMFDKFLYNKTTLGCLIDMSKERGSPERVYYSKPHNSQIPSTILD